MYWPSATTSPGSIAPAPSYGFNAWLLGARLASFGGYATGFAGASAVELRAQGISICSNAIELADACIGRL